MRAIILGRYATWTDSFMYLQYFPTAYGTAAQANGQVIVSQIDAANQTISGTFKVHNDSVYSYAHYKLDQQTPAGGYFVYYNAGWLDILQNDLSSHWLVANFQLTVTDSTGVDSVVLTNGHFSIRY